MGTGFVFQIADERPEDELSAHCESAMEILDDADERFSLYKPESEISRLVRGELEWKGASGHQKSIADQCDYWREKTAGYFDAREGSEYDPSGLVKTWAAKNAANYLAANGIAQFTLNAGGDIFLSERLTDPLLNRVGLSNLNPIASKTGGVNMVLDLAGTDFRAVATSGISERGEHIWRKEGGREIIQVSVVAKDLVQADVWATAIMSGSNKAWDLFLREPDMVAIGTFRDGSIVSSPGFTDLLARL